MIFCPKCGSKLTSQQSCGKCGIIWGEIMNQESEPMQQQRIDQEKHTFSSGATSSRSLPGYDMLPEIFLTRIAKRFTLGAEKYGKFNYRKGLKDKAFIIDRLNHAFLHLKKAIDLIENDTPFEDDNLGAVGVNIAMAMEYEVENNLYKFVQQYKSILTDDEALRTAVEEGQKLGAMKMPDGWPKTCSCVLMDGMFSPSCPIHGIKIKG